jgi:hypothetical protein
MKKKIDIEYMLDVMRHFFNGGEVVSKIKVCDDDPFELDLHPSWNWDRYHYERNPEKKKLYAIYNEGLFVFVTSKRGVALNRLEQLKLTHPESHILTFTETE